MRVTSLILAATLLFACSNETSTTTEQLKQELTYSAGKLFIIGGGSRPDHMIDRLIQESGLDSSGYGIIFPMSSSEQDSSIFYARKQFDERGVSNIRGIMMSQGDELSESLLDSITRASLIYIGGGDQSRFMDIIEGSRIQQAVHDCYNNGGVVAGTSAGAAVMSEIMITGDERITDDYGRTLRNVLADNIITRPGLGLVSNMIIDQHFVKRSRYNRLVSLCLEHPNLLGVGIDEATAVLIYRDSAEVVGDSQVVLVKALGDVTRSENNLLGSEDIRVSILLPGDKFAIPD